MDAPSRLALRTGFLALAFSVPFGMTLEALHACKVAAYLEHPMRRELWTLAHAHGNLLGILLLAFASVAERAVPDVRSRMRSARLLVGGGVAIPLGFLLSGLDPTEGDPGLAIGLVPLGALALLLGLLGAACARPSSGSD